MHISTNSVSTFFNQVSRSILISVILILFTLSSSAQLSGTYTIGSTGNYLTFNEAVDTLISQGVTGPVVFDVQDGVYTEQFEIPSITGASLTNTITFQSLSQDSTAVTLIHTAAGSTDNYIVKMNGAGFITFSKMGFLVDGASYATAIYFLSGSNDNTFQNCLFFGKTTTSSSANYSIIYSASSPDDNNVFDNNIFYDGANGLRYQGQSSSILSTGTVITNNQFYNQSEYALRLYYQEAIVIDNNIMDLNNGTAYGMRLDNCDKNIQITNNKINVQVGYEGIYLYYCDGNSVQRGDISNNFISVGGTTTAYGIHFEYCNYQNVFYNSVYITSPNTTSGRAFYHNGTGGNLDFRNNIFANFGGGYAFYSNTVSSITSLDYNDYFTTGNFLAYWGSPQEDLAAFVAASGMNANSVDVNPVYTSLADLHTTTFRLDGIGDNTTGIALDIDGDARAGTPDIGADEFTGAGVALAGPYTVGGSTPDFATLTAAVDSLNEVGISADVTFNLRDGSYNEQVSILDIAGSTTANRVTFQSESQDSSLVNITFSTGSTNDYIVELLATDYVNFRHLSLTATGGSQGTVFSMWGSTRGDSISNCVINGIAGIDDVIAANDQLFNELVINNNVISNGANGMRLDGYDSQHSGTVEVFGNVVSGQTSTGLYLEDCDACIFSANSLTSNGSTSYRGLWMEDCNNDIQVVKNVVIVSGNTGGAVRVSNCTGTISNKGLVANNMLSTAGASTSYGIYSATCTYLNVFHNSTRVASTSITNGRGYYNSGGANIDVRNNIFSNFGPGYAYHNSTSAAIVSSDYNNLMTTGTFVGYWGGANRTDLTAFQAANSMDVNSVSVNPGFVSNTDLHSTTFFLDSAGTPITSVPDDIDGDPRDLTVPDIGADEFTSTQFPLNGPYTIGGTSPDYVTVTDAVDDLNTLGVSGWVTFYIRNGTYVEQMRILEISGANSADTVTFTADTNNVTAVVITFAGTSTDDYVFWLNNADFVSLAGLTLVATGTFYSKVIVFSGYTTDINITDNLISSANAATNSSSIYCSDNITERVLIRNNTIVEGGYGIYFNGNSTTFSTGTLIDSNTFDGQAQRAIYLEDQTDPWVVGNDINNSNATGYRGIEFSDVDNGFQIIGNKIVSSQTNDGIRIYNCNATLVFQSYIQNNFVQVGGTSTAYGLSISSSDYVNINHNNVNITSTSATAGLSLYVTGGTNITIQNNVLSNQGAGYAYYINTAAAITASDYNDIYALGTNLGFWSGTGAVTDLAALQAASGMDANSISINPIFTTSTDLHVGEVALMGTATPLGVLLDFDGQLRDLSNPDIGADEFFCQTPTFSVSITDPCLGDSTIFVDNSTDIEVGSTWDWDFDNDFVADYSSGTGGETLSYLYGSGGTQTANLIISQIAGCVDTLVMSPVVNTFPILSLSSTGVYCDSANGTATVVVSSGTAPYTYTWSSGATSSMATALDIGLYTVAVTDINNCTTLDTVSVTESIEVVVILISGSTCGNSDGIAQVTSVTGGFPPYDYVWSTGDTTDTDSSLYSGIHYVTIIDVNGCVAFGTITVSDIGAGVSVGPLSQTNNACFGDQNGAINILIVGGTTPYDIVWSNAATTQNISGLGEGIYEVVVTDALGCVATDSYTITAPDDITVAVVVSQASCGGSDGSAVVVASGGVTPYTYDWSTGGTNQIESGLAAGIYSVTITDQNLCTEVAGVIVSNIGGPVVAVNSVTGVNCNNPSIGAIDISVSGGLPPYTYLWSNADTTEDISGLTVGNYNVSVTDANGCTGTESVDIVESIPATPEICLVTVDTITGTNLVVWEKQGGQNIDYYNIYKEGTQSGIYFLIGSRPFDSLSVFVDSFANPQLRSWRYKISSVDSCGQESQRSGIHKTLHLTVNLGLTAEINLIWDDYSGFAFSSYIIFRGPDVANLTAIAIVPSTLHTYVDPSPPAGTQLYIVSAQHPTGGCTATKVKNFNSAKSNTSSVGNVADSLGTSTASNNATQGNCDGTATVSVTGGVTPYTFLWGTSPAQTDSIATGLCAGTYGVTITDAAGDTISTSVTVIEDLNLAGTISSNNATAGNCDGNATISVIGGTPPYTYSWNTSPVQTDSVATGLCAGSYDVTVTDAAGDTISVSVTITENQNLAGTAATTNATAGNCDGTATVVPTGGYPPYTYTWGTVPAQTGATATGLCPNTYTVIVQDSLGGTTTAAATVGEEVSIDNIGLEESLVLFPNPNQGSFNISFVHPAGDNLLVRIFDMKGDIIWEKYLNPGSASSAIKVDLESPVSGIYQLQILSGKGMVNRKVLIE